MPRPRRLFRARMSLPVLQPQDTMPDCADLPRRPAAARRPPVRGATAMDTSTNLLEQLRHPADARAWERFVDLYTPLLYGWACGQGLRDADAADLIQEVFVVLV